MVGTVYSSVNSGVFYHPILLGGLLHNSQHKMADLHLKSLRYSIDYLSNFIYQTEQGTFENKITLQEFDTEGECLENLQKNNQKLLESYFPVLGATCTNLPIMKTYEIGTVRLPLEKVSKII